MEWQRFSLRDSFYTIVSNSDCVPFLGLRNHPVFGVTITSSQQGDIIWDGTVPGFGARRQKGDCVTYLLKYRTAEGRQRWFTIGRHGAPWTPDLARDEAIRILGAVKGVGGKRRDPAAEKSSARKATTVAGLCDAYLADAEAGKLLTRPMRPRSVAIVEGRLAICRCRSPPQVSLDPQG